MTTPAWPATVNQNMILGSYQETPDRNIASFQPEVGPAIERRRTSLPSTVIKFQQRLTAAERAALKSFFENDVLEGVLAFTRKNPATAEDITCKFSDVITYQDAPGGKFTASISLRVLP